MAKTKCARGRKLAIDRARFSKDVPLARWKAGQLGRREAISSRRSTACRPNFMLNDCKTHDTHPFVFHGEIADRSFRIIWPKAEMSVRIAEVYGRIKICKNISVPLAHHV